MGPVDLQVVRPMQPLGSMSGLLSGLFAALAGHSVLQPRRGVTVEVEFQWSGPATAEPERRCILYGVESKYINIDIRVVNM